MWTVEHVVVPKDYQSVYPYSPSGKMPGPEESPIPDPLIWLSYVAAQTSTINLATGILILPERNPVVLAKQAASLDQISGGRFLLGVGVGWLKEEFDAIGVPFAERAARTDDSVAAMRALWTEDAATYHSEFTNFDDCILRPRPAQGSVPIVVGGHSDAAARRAGRVGDGFFPGKGSPEELRRMIGIARETAENAGRDPDALEITLGGAGRPGQEGVDEAGRLAELGADRVVVPAFNFWRDPEASLAQFGAEVIT